LIWQFADRSAAANDRGFFQYKFQSKGLGNIPYWLVALALFFIVNGLFLIKFVPSVLSGSGGHFDPFPALFASFIILNLLLIPILVVGVVVVRGIGL